MTPFVCTDHARELLIGLDEECSRQQGRVKELEGQVQQLVLKAEERTAEHLAALRVLTAKCTAFSKAAFPDGTLYDGSPAEPEDVRNLRENYASALNDLANDAKAIR